jgi:hypothetical protein
MEGLYVEAISVRLEDLGGVLGQVVANRLGVEHVLRCPMNTKLVVLGHDPPLFPVGIYPSTSPSAWGITPSHAYP